MKRFLSLGIVLLLLCPVVAEERDPNGVALDSLSRLVEAEKAAPVSQAKAEVLRRYAFTLQKKGRTEESQEYARQAYDMFVSLGDYGKASLCLYECCIAYHSIGDTVHMRSLMTELQALAEQDTSALTQHNYYSILFAWYMAQQDAESAAKAGRSSIRYMNRIDNCRQYNIVPAWNYYNQALLYDLLYQPPLTDSIIAYLDLAETNARQERALVDRQEAMISISDERAWLYYYKKDYARAEKMMSHVLELIDSVALSTPATVVTERGEAYAFFVELYETQGRYAEALHYQQLLTENNQLRYDIERQRVLDEIQTKYEVSQQQLLVEKERTRVRVLRLLLVIAGLVVMVVMAALLLLWLRKKHVEQQLYAQLLEKETLQLLHEDLMRQIGELSEKKKFKKEALERMRNLNLQSFKSAIAGARDLSTTDKRYLMCFAAGIPAEQVAEIFSVSSSSVYTVRYRIRKKTAFPW